MNYEDAPNADKRARGDGAPSLSHDYNPSASVDHIQRLSEIDHPFDLVICDLWGVMHNGVTANIEAVEALMQLRENGVATVFLSNAPRPRYHVRNQLQSMGMPPQLTDLLVTSGGLARDAVRTEFQGAKLYHLGPGDDHNTVEGLPVDLVDHPDQAEVILATDLDFTDIEKHRALLSGACDHSVPLLCANPDRVVHVGEKLYACAGAVADLYTDMGGTVHWFGKPMPEALISCVSEAGLQEVDGDRVLMIGDSLQTDIAGAAAAGFHSLFIAGGIHRDEWATTLDILNGNQLSAQAFAQIYGNGKPMPNWIMHKLIW